MTQPSTPGRMSPMVRLAVAILGAVIAAAVIGHLAGGTGPGGVPDVQWRETEVLGLTVLSTGPFRGMPVPVPDAVRPAIERMESAARDAGDTEMRVSRTEFRAGVPLNLEGSAQGAVDALRGNPAITQMTHSHARTVVSGVPAVRTTSTFHVEGRPAHGEILSVLRGRTLWQVQVLGPEKDAPEIARRVMESVRLQP